MNELQQRILAELEEARNENIYSLLNTVIDPIGVDTEIAEYKSALESLIKEGHILMGLDPVYDKNTDIYSNYQLFSKEKSLFLVNNLDEMFLYNSKGHHWTWSSRDYEDRTPNIDLTDKGYDKSVKILDERGYRWWQPNEER